MAPAWIADAMFYHLFPLGLCGAPPRNDFRAPPIERLAQLLPWAAHIADLGLNAVYLGPLFESSAHGYDTANYYQVDRRLGSSAGLRELTGALKARGLRVIFDGVFNHVGRDFWAFRDVQANGAASRFSAWFHQLDFSQRSPYGDAFAYTGWAGHYDLVKLDVGHPEVRAHLFGAIDQWIELYDIDGLRLDAADALDLGFLQALAAHCRQRRPDFWLMGEVVHGDYRRWANPDTLDATTNYECYKGLYSSFASRNLFEIAYSLNRQFGAEGIYRDLLLYSFADNHDVARVASRLDKPQHLYPLYALLFTMPGVPSLYYGSEWGLAGTRAPSSDAPLRPALDLAQMAERAPHPDLMPAIRRLAALRRDLPALRHGDYQQLYVAHEQLAFARSMPGQRALVLLNGADRAAAVAPHGVRPGQIFYDRLNGERVVADGRGALSVYPNWARVLVDG